MQYKGLSFSSKRKKYHSKCLTKSFSNNEVYVQQSASNNRVFLLFEEKSVKYLAQQIGQGHFSKKTLVAVRFQMVKLWNRSKQITATTKNQKQILNFLK